MRYQHVIEAVYGRPWLVTPGAHSAIVAIVEQHAHRLYARDPGVDACGGAVEVPSMRIDGNLAIIPVGGVLARGVSAFERGAGVTDYLDIQREIEQAVADPAVRDIWLDVDSPGGTVEGCQECAEAISLAAASKNVFAHTSGTMASAAYWLGSAASAVFGSPSSTVGSIGVYAPFFDVTERMKAAGVKVELFTSGPLKGAGFPGTSLTPEQRAEMQGMVDSLAGKFKAHVSSHRPGIAAESMRGGVYPGDDAVALGFLDGNFRDLAAAVAAVSGVPSIT